MAIVNMPGHNPFIISFEVISFEVISFDKCHNMQKNIISDCLCKTVRNDILLLLEASGMRQTAEQSANAPTQEPIHAA